MAKNPLRKRVRASDWSEMSFPQFIQALSAE
jgi:hypothetical protein